MYLVQVFRPRREKDAAPGPGLHDVSTVGVDELERTSCKVLRPAAALLPLRVPLRVSLRVPLRVPLRVEVDNGGKVVEPDVRLVDVRRTWTYGAVLGGHLYEQQVVNRLLIVC